MANEVANNEVANEMINNQINQLERQIKYSKPQHYKQYCICELCYKYRDMVLTKEYLEKMLNNTEKQQL